MKVFSADVGNVSEGAESDLRLRKAFASYEYRTLMGSLSAHECEQKKRVTSNKGGHDLWKPKTEK